MNKKIYKALEKIVGPQYITDRDTDRQSYAYDATQIQAWPDGVVFPGTTQEISEILKLANSYQFPVVPRGAGSGMSGGSVPIRGGVVLVLLRMNRIKTIDTNNFLAVVEPGVITRDLQQAVEAKGLFYPPDPSSSHFSTLGGNLAECSGGGSAVKYGVTRDYVLGLEVVLPSGEILKTGVQTAKGVVGYDLTRLMVGSEGTLGIITKMALKLIPMPEARKTILAFFDRMTLAAQTVVEIFRAGILPSTLEFMDHSSIACVEEFLHLGLPTQAQALLLIEVDGDHEAVARQGETIQRICRQIGAMGVKKAATPSEAEELWKARRAISPALFRLRPNKINEDIVVPRDKIPEAIELFEGIGRRFELLVVSFGHAGDGNIHVNIMFDGNKSGEQEKAREALAEIFKTVLELGGTLSGEHGVGLTKAPFLSLELDPVSLILMKKIKDLFDPNHILNPGKIFP
ncbi:MAG: FAD-binding protein [Deltaproteobacteria bacterium]|nr:FAD-binding protein [Deltaproteobacteria bacterium]